MNFKALTLLNNIVIDGVTYKIVDITRNFEELSTKISLHNASRFDFSSTIPELSEVPNDNSSSLTTSIFTIPPFYAVSGTVVNFNVVEIFEDSGEIFVRNSAPYESSYPFKFGIALTTGVEPLDADERVYTTLALDGDIVDIDFLASIGSVGDKIYMKTGDGILNPNITNDLPTYTPLDLPIDELPLWVEVGTIIEPTKLKVQFRKFIMEAI
jgi:hypothetical protein